MKPLALALAAAIAALGPVQSGAQAQDAMKVPRIGYLSPGAPDARNEEAFRAGLRELGYEEGRNIRVEYRRASGHFDRLPDLANELLGLDVNLIVASVTQAALAAKAATTRTPIVIAGVADPVSVGLVPSLARPGGNVTGTSGMSAAIVGKQLEILNELSPGTASIAVLWNPANLAFQSLQVKEAEDAGRALNVQLQMVEARSPEDLDRAFAAVERAGARALLVLSDPVYVAHAEAIASRAVRRHLPTISGARIFAEAGGLIAYGPSYDELHRRAAVYVDKILKGAQPADLAIEQPTLFELVVNLKTVRTLGVVIPPQLLARADEVIE